MKWFIIRLTLCLLGAFVVPIIVCSIYIDQTRFVGGVHVGASEDSDLTDLVFVFSCVGLGMLFLSGLPVHWGYRILAGITYIPVFGYFLLIYWIGYECSQAKAWP